VATSMFRLFEAVVNTARLFLLYKPGIYHATQLRQVKAQLRFGGKGSGAEKLLSRLRIYGMLHIGKGAAGRQ